MACAVDDLEKRIQVYEQQSGETVTDNLKICCVVSGLEKSSLKEHLMVAGAKAQTWAEFMKEVGIIELAKRSAQGPTPMQVDAFPRHV